MKKATLLCMGLILTFALTACGKKAADNEDNQNTDTQESSTESTPVEEDNTKTDTAMADIKAAVVEALGENYWPNMEVDAQLLSDMFGITEDLYDDYLAEMPAISTNVDTLLVIKAKEGQLEALEAAVNAYRERMVGDTMQYPMNLGKIQASMIETIGDYVCFVQLGADVTEAMDVSDEAVIEHCQEANEAALEAIRNVLAQ